MDHAILSHEWERHFGAIWRELDHLLASSGSATAVLLDAAGNAVTYAGEDPDFDLSSFSSLAVADYLATREIAAILGEKNLRWVVHQGTRAGVVLVPLHPLLILGVLFDERTTLGLVRHQIRKARERLEEATRPLLHILERQIGATSEDADEDRSKTAESIGFSNSDLVRQQALGDDKADDDVVAESLKRLFAPSA